MSNLERDITEEILAAHNLRPAALGLRFDRVAQSVLAGLRAFVEDAGAPGITVLMTLTAPIRLPGRTVEALKGEIGRWLATPAPSDDRVLEVHGNGVRLRLLTGSRGPAFVGFVHNPQSPAERLLQLAEGWLVSIPASRVAYEKSQATSDRS